MAAMKARKRGRPPKDQIPETVPEPEAPEAPLGEESIEGEITEGTIFDVTGHDLTYVKVFRRDDVDRTWVFHGRLATEEATIDRVAELFGGGTYRVQLFQRSEKHGKHTIHRQTTFKLPGAYRPPREVPLSGLGDVQAPRESARVESPDMPQINPASALNTALVSQVVDLIKVAREPKSSPLDAMLPHLLDLAGKFMESRQASSSDGTVETLKLMLAQQAEEMRELRRTIAAQREATPTRGLKETLEEITSIRELLLPDSPPDPESMMWAAGLKAFEALASQTKGAQVPAPNPNPAGTLPASDLPAWKRILLAQKKNLLMAASLGLSPETAAEVAIKRMPPQVQGVIMEFLRRPDHVDITMQEIPELREFEGWTRDFFAVASDMLLGTPEDDEEDSDDQAE